jgi:hypothetical protein
VSNGANRIRLAAEAVAMMAGPALPVHRFGAEANDLGGFAIGTNDSDTPTTGVPSAAATDEDAGPPQHALQSAGIGVSDAASGTARWFRELAQVLEHPVGAGPSLPAVCPAEAEARVLDTFRESPGALSDTAILGPARTLWGASLYVDDVTRMQHRLIHSVTHLNLRRAPNPDPERVSS